jgi:peroxiredoxin
MTLVRDTESALPSASGSAKTGAIAMEEAVRAQLEKAQQKWLDLWRRGPLRTRWRSMPLQIGDLAPSLRLQDHRGETVDLASVWRNRPALLVFWRHFGCSAGFARAQALRESWGELAAGLHVVAIGQAEPERTAWYVRRRDLPVAMTFLCDPEGLAYEAFGLLDGLPHQVLFRLPEPMQRRDFEAGVAVAAQRRHAGDPLVDSPWLMPGEFLVDASGVVHMAHRYTHIFDAPEPAILLAALRSL